MTIAPESEVNPNQKGSEISGGLLTEEAMDSADLLAKNRGIGIKGAQQYYTPRPAAELIAGIIGKDATVLDPTAGDGSLLVAFDPGNSFGVEIDEDQIKAAEGSYKSVHGDIQQVYSMIRRAVTFDAVVANPPFGLKWSEPTLNDGKETNSALLTLMMANRLIDEEDGQIVFIAGKGTFDKSILNHPDARGIYAILDCAELFPGTMTPAVIAFGFHPQNSRVKLWNERNEEPARRGASLDTIDLLDRWVEEQREHVYGYRYRSYYGHTSYSVGQAWPTINAEHKRRRSEKEAKGKREFTVQIFGGNRLDVKIQPYTRLVLDKMGKLHNLEKLHGLSTDYFIQNQREWNFLKGIEADDLITVDPKLDGKVEESLRQMYRVLCPLYPLRKVQRLGFLSDLDSLLCIKSDAEKGFDKGARYELTTKAKPETASWVAAYQLKGGERAGEWEDRRYTKRYTVLEIRVGHFTMNDSEQDANNIAWLVEHFDIPDPGDVSTRFPEEVAAHRALLKEVEAEMLENALVWDEENNVPEHKRFQGFRTFQIEDLARMLVKNDGLLSWEQGLGKTVGAIAWFLAQKKLGLRDQLLVVCPKDLIDQWQREMTRFTGKKMHLINTHGKAHWTSRYLRNGGKGHFVTYHEALSLVGTRRSKAADEVIVEEREEEKLIKGTGTYGYWKHDETGQPVECSYNQYTKALEAGTETVGHGGIPARYRIAVKQITSKELCPNCKADHKDGWDGKFCSATIRSGNGDTRKCGYAHWAIRIKPMASLLATAFKKGAIVLDEATMIGGSRTGGRSQRSLAFCGLRSRRTLAMTGTPIKNYVNQLFWPLWFALGNDTPRFPYGYEHKNKFLKDFAVEQVAMDKLGRQIATTHLPEVTNLSRFWRMIASSTIRRRVEDTGEPIVPLNYYDIRAPLGMNQQKRIDMWAKTFGAFFKEEHPDTKCSADWATQMQMLLGGIPKNEYAELMPCADPHKDWRPDANADPLGKYADIDVSNYTPSVLRALEVVMALVKDGRKVLFGSPLVKTSRFVSDALKEKGVHAIHILTDSDDTQKPEDRAATVFDFQTNEVDVLCTGVQAIRFGHNLDAASSVVLLGFPWDFETLDQFVKRVRRLTSRKPIDVFCVIPGVGTVTNKKWDLLQKKSDTASLALDGKIIPKNEIEIDRDQILAELVEKGVRAEGDEIDEAEVKVAWENLPHINEYEPPVGLIPVPPAHVPATVEVNPLIEIGRLATERRIATEKAALYLALRAAAFTTTMPPVEKPINLVALFLELRSKRSTIEATHIEASDEYDSDEDAPEIDETPENVDSNGATPATDLTEILNRLKKLEDENAELKAKVAASTVEQLSLEIE